MKFMHLVTFAALLLTSLPASRVQAAEKHKQVIVILDLSASRTAPVLADAQAFVARLAQQLSFGDQFVVLQMQQEGLQGNPKRWMTTLPVPKEPNYVTSRDKEHLTAAERGIGYAMPTFFKGESAKIMHTDIFATLLIAGEYVSEAGGRDTTIVLLSDMLQSAKGIEMEKAARMPGPGWIEQQKRIGLIPRLPNACIAVVGADATDRNGVKVRDFWQSYFLAAGASLQLKNYRATAPSGNLNC